MPPGDMVFFRNVGLDDRASSDQTSSVGEPSLANNGQQLFMSGNWYASKSLDDGANWEVVSPFTTLPGAAGGFCCDQLVHYDRSRDLSFWLLQYIADGNGENVFRLAVKRGATFENNAWYWWDFSPPGVNGAWTNEWFDYPDMALSDNHLWVTFNLFDRNSRWTRAVVFRFPLDTLATGAALGYSYWSTTNNGSLRLVRGAGDTMYWASHNSRSQIRLFRWIESGNNITFWDIGVNEWNSGNYSAPGPDGNNWLSRCDPRITGAWLAKGVLGFMWTVNSRGDRPLPHVRVVRINEVTKAVMNQPDIWSSSAAYAYPDACPNDRGHVGVTMFYGGGRTHPSHVVGVSDDYSVPWELWFTRVGTNGPTQGTWGDYLSCRRHSPDGLTWIASGFTLQGGNERRHVEPRYVHFGRRRDERSVARWSGS